MPYRVLLFLILLINYAHAILNKNPYLFGHFFSKNTNAKKTLGIVTHITYNKNCKLTVVVVKNLK